MRFFNRWLPVTAAFVVLAAIMAVCRAQNPIIQTNFTADPAPMVYNGTVYLYTSHDQDDASQFKMVDWKLYTSTDMANWTDHGTVASLATFAWAVQTNDAWAPQVVERGGKFYLYAPISVAGSPKNVIAVAVADSPLGPFKDALGHALISPASDNIDPTVFVDDDGQAYLYWGNPHLWYVKLNQDMISYAGAITKVDSKPDNYQEGPWFYKRQGRYYMAYASHCCPEGVGYAMSANATGPWEYKGMLMEPDKRSSGNHPGIIDFKGSSYVFGFNYQLNFALTSEHRERRSVCVRKFTYNSDGTITTLPWWDESGVTQVGTLDPYLMNEAETIAWESGVKTAQDSHGNVYVTQINNGSYIKVRGANFGTKKLGKKPSQHFTARLAALGGGGSIHLRLDSMGGREIAVLPVVATGGPLDWKSMTTSIVPTEGVHDLYLVFDGSGAEAQFNFDSWKFE